MKRERKQMSIEDLDATFIVRSVLCLVEDEAVKAKKDEL
jgi:hypothetical protein